MCLVGIELSGLRQVGCGVGDLTVVKATSGNRIRYLDVTLASALGFDASGRDSRYRRSCFKHLFSEFAVFGTAANKLWWPCVGSLSDFDASGSLAPVGVNLLGLPVGLVAHHGPGSTAILRAIAMPAFFLRVTCPPRIRS